MNEEKNTCTDYSTAALGALLSEKEMIAANLRMLKGKLEDEDKCTVCHAIQVLEQKESNSFGSDFYVMLMFLCMFGFGGSNSFLSSPDFLNILNESLKKYTDSIEKGQEF